MKNELAAYKSIIHYGLWGGLVPGNRHLLKALHEQGVVGFKAFLSNSGVDEFERSDDQTLIEGMQEIAKLGSILAVHAESEVITHFLSKEPVKKGGVPVRNYSDTRPICSEIEAVERLLAFATVTGCKLHIVHVSSSQVLKKISEAKQRGVDVTVETCPHYLSLTVEDVVELGALTKCAPPIREASEVESLWELVKRGEIDTIGTDHSPAPLDLKQGEFFEAWGGISGAQSGLNVMLEEGYHKREVSLETIVKIMAENPTKRFGLYPQKGAILPGSNADLTLIDLHAPFF